MSNGYIHCSLFILLEKLQYDVKSVAKQSVLWWSGFLSLDTVTLEEGIKICALLTAGHSIRSMSFVLNNDFAFTGDAILVAHDLPIFVDCKESIYSLDRINELSEVQYFCPAWDEIYDKISLKEVINESKRMLQRLMDAVHKVETEYKELNKDEKILMIYKQAGILEYAGNPLVVKSIEACREYLYKIYC